MNEKFPSTMKSEMLTLIYKSLHGIGYILDDGDINIKDMLAVLNSLMRIITEHDFDSEGNALDPLKFEQSANLILSKLGLQSGEDVI